MHYPTPEQDMLRDTLARWLADRATAPRLPDEFDAQHDAAVWQGLGQLGLTSLLAPEEAEALGGGGPEAMLVLQGLGRAGLATPYLEHAVLAMLALRAQPAAAPWLERMRDGRALVAVAFDEAHSRYDWHAVAAQVRPLAQGAAFIGSKTGVRHAPQADALLVSALLDGRPALWLLPREGCTLSEVCRSLDGAPLATVALPAQAPQALLLAQGEAATACIARLHGWHVAGLAAQAAGAMDAACAMTARYLGERKQFGQALSQFQVLRHRFIDMRVQLLKAEAVATVALHWADAADGPERRQALAAAKLSLSLAARHVAQQAVQLHGAIGLTAEYGLGPLVRLLTAASLLGGDADHCAATLGDSLLRESVSLPMDA